MENSAAELWTETRRKRIRGRFRATLAGLLELEALRVRHKEMVEAALEKQESPDDLDKHEGRYEYWVEESSFRLKLKRSLSQENLSDAGNPRMFLDLRRMWVPHSSQELQDLHSPECEDRQSRLSSGFCESHNDVMSSLSTSLASLSHQSTDSSAPCGRELHRNSTCTSPLLKNKQEHVRKGDSKTPGFSKVVIPDAGFLSVVDLYPDSHWPHISEILQPQVVLESSYRSDLKSHQGPEVYHYPSPLHAVALQSPLYAPQSPEHKRKNETCSPGTLTSNGSSLSRSDFVSGQKRVFESPRSLPHSPTTIQSLVSVTPSSAPLTNHWCMDTLLKRARSEMRNHTMAECSGITSWSRSSASLHRTCSMGKSRTSSSFNPVSFQCRAASSESGPPTFSQIPSLGLRGLRIYKNQMRRHTAALTNLNTFTENNRTLCTRTSAETSVLHHRHSFEAPEVFMR